MNATHMKHFATAAALLLSMPLWSQLNNGGFEELNESAMPAYWQGNIAMIHFWVDENGVFHSDSVEYDGPSHYFLNTTDPHSGSNAMELRNAYNHTQQRAIVGTWIASSDPTDYLAFPVIDIGASERPLAITFWAKCTIAGGDAVHAEARVTDEEGNELGTGTWSMGETVVDYRSFTMPIDYVMTGTPAFFQLRFSTAAPNAPSTLGTRLVIDDVSVDYIGTGITEESPATRVSVYPNPASHTVSFALPATDRIIAARAVDATGRSSALSVSAQRSTDLSALAAGPYTLELLTSTGAFHSRLLVVR